MEFLISTFQSVFAVLFNADFISFLFHAQEILGIITDSLKDYFNFTGNGEVVTPSI